MSGFDNSSYIYCLLMVIGGNVILGFGISITVTANIIMNSGEAFVKAVSETLNRDFGNTKIFFDIYFVLLSIVLSLLFFDFQIKGTREGTVIAAVFTGLVIKFFLNLFKKIISKG